MSLMDVIKKIGGKEPDEEYIPKQVIDKRLDGLRRLRQVQVNEDEKVRLKQEIENYNRERTAKHLFGIKSKLNQKKKEGLIRSIKEKKVNILSNERSILSGSELDNKKQEFKKKVNILSNHSSFLK